MVKKTIGDILVEPEQANLATAMKPVKNDPGSFRILIVDDCAINIMVAGKMLEFCGLRFDTVSGGREALEVAHQIKYDLILMDVRMPEMSGIEATRQIRQQCPLNFQTPIIALTANALPEDCFEYLQAGMNDYLAKPIGYETMGRVLEKWLSPDSGQTKAS